MVLPPLQIYRLGACGHRIRAVQSLEKGGVEFLVEKVVEATTRRGGRQAPGKFLVEKMAVRRRRWRRAE
jgi:hypothetical protein|uniref:Uncharacterized protein n=2 Tax=Oryza TaxID=4527 RepID=A0A0E0MWW1_ORYRU